MSSAKNNPDKTDRSGGLGQTFHFFNWWVIPFSRYQTVRGSDRQAVLAGTGQLRRS